MLIPHVGMSINFGVIGGAWRAEFFAKLSNLYPDLWNLTGNYIRNPEKAANWEKTWNRPASSDYDEFLSQDLDFVITSVPREVNPTYVRSLVDAGIPVLSETPPAVSIEELIELYSYVEDNQGKVQVAEQYHLRPHNQVQIKLAHSSLIGEPSYVMISSGHGYHGISLLRRSLGVGTEAVKIWSRKVETPIMKGPDRSGFQPEDKFDTSHQNIYYFEFENGKYGLIDFSYDQYFGYIRSERMLIRGEIGEINNDQVRWMENHDSPRLSTIERIQTGINADINGSYLLSLNFKGDEIYRNPYLHGNLMDEDLAVAHMLDAMTEYVTSDRSFYSLAEGSHDQYLTLLGVESQDNGEMISSDPMPWDNSL